MTCEYCKKCLRYGYTLYLQAKRDYPPEGPPDRATLLWEGFATPEMTRTKIDPKTGKVIYLGIYAQTMPQPGDTGTWCPDTQGLNPAEECQEYRKEDAYRRKYEKYREAKMQQQYERFPNMTRRVGIAKSVRQYVSKRDKYTCVYCGRYYADLKELGIKTCVDHVIPLAQGGGNTEDNMAFCCEECNSLKRANVWQRGCRVGMV